jgi:hypothetical protein
MSARAIVAALAALLFAPGVGAAPPEAERPRAAHAERPSKPTGPIAVDHRLAAAPQVGVPLAIFIAARTASAATLSLEATASQPDSLSVAAPRLVSAAEGRFEWAVEVIPLAADAGFVNVVVAGEIDGIPQARSVAIALRMTADAVERTPTAADGEALIALPVDESR